MTFEIKNNLPHSVPVRKKRTLSIDVENEQSIGEIEALALETYDKIAREYYTSAHPTSQAFDRIIERYLRGNPLLLKPSEYYLDVGSGKTKLPQIENKNRPNCVLIDISRKMILHSKNVDGERILAVVIFLQQLQLEAFGRFLQHAL